MRRNLNLLNFKQGCRLLFQIKPSAQTSVCQAKETISAGLVLLAKTTRDGWEAVDQNGGPSFFLLESGLSNPKLLHC